MRERILLLTLFCAIFFSGCNEPVPDRPKLPDVPAFTVGDTVSRTLLIYMMAENDLSAKYQNFSQYDMGEIKRAAMLMPDDGRLFVFLDNSDSLLLPSVFQYHHHEGRLVENVVYRFGNDVCSSDTAALGIVMREILAEYPTRNLDLVMWSHGDGWLRGVQKSGPSRSIGVDNGNNSYSQRSVKSIEIDELAALLESLPVKVDRLLFDACFMQCTEVVYALRNAVNWVIASPAEIPGYGAPYDTMVPEFFGPESSVADIMYAYKLDYDNDPDGVVLSAVNAHAMQELADCTKQYVLKYFGKENSNSYAGLFAYLPGGSYSSSKAYPAYFDMNSAMKYFLDEDDYASWKIVFDKAVPLLMVSNSKQVYSVIKGEIAIDMNGCGGVSMYIPQDEWYTESFNNDFRATEWYSSAGWDEAGW